MKRLVVFLLVLSSFAFANNHKHKMFQSVPANKATILQSGKAKQYCPECGMTLHMFYKTNHAAVVNGKIKQYCSLHCLVEDAVKNGAKLSDIKVVDTKTLKFIDATKAFYVVGSKKKGTMSKVSKYAFAKRSDAEVFAKKFGGSVMKFDKVYKKASKMLGKEMKMIAKKQTMMAKKGGKMYNKMCKKTNKHFNSTAEAKAYLKSSGICGNIKGKKLQAIGLYLYKR